MALTTDLSRAQLAFQVSGGDPGQLSVIRYKGSEGIAQLYRFEIELAADQGEIPFERILGKTAVLSINTLAGPRWFHGIVSRFEMTGETHNQLYFRAELVPALWLLSHRYGSRIFQKKTVPEIISTVLTDGGILSNQVSTLLQRSYEPREYCVQYRETDYTFICRLMEEEGIWWYFQQSQAEHKLVLADSPAAYAPITGDAKLLYHAPTGMNVTEEHVSWFRLGQAIRPGAVVLRDFSFEQPPLNLEAKSDCGRDSHLEFYDCPGEYVQQGAGQNLAKIRAEEFEAGRTVAIGQTNSYRLAPGLTFELTEHPSEGANLEYLITQLTHQGKQSTTRTASSSLGRGSFLDGRVQQSLIAARRHENPAIRELAEALLQIGDRIRVGDPTAHRELPRWLYHAGQISRELSSAASVLGGNPLEALSIPNLLDDLSSVNLVDVDAPVYECRFECIPAKVAYRPPRITPWPVMRGSQTARVVGPKGEEIHTDEFGRVKVQFNWDREGKFDDKSSCWIRVSQGSAGGQYGIMFLPRVGQEVIVDFLEGDPDKPIITGRVYNGDHKPPYKLPDEKTKSVIKTNSSKGGGGTNEIRFEDLKDKEQILVYAQKDLHVRVKHDRVENVENDHHLTVGNDRFEEIKKNYHLKLVEGNKNEEIGKDLSLHVKGKGSVKVDGTQSMNVAGDVVEKFGANHKHEVAMTYAAKALSIKLEASTGIELKCGGSSIVLTPAAIFIVGGPLVNINSGSGPPVSPVTASATAPVAPEKPLEADKAQPGKDVTYDGGEERKPAEGQPEVPGQEFKPTEVEEKKKKSWIRIRLIDEARQPVPGERYRVIAPDGAKREGSLDSNGEALISGIEPGTCQISFPDLDAEAWERV